MTYDEVIKLQQDLNNRGFGPLVVDGIYGEKTESAYSKMIELSDANGVGTAMPVPPPVKPWWLSKALISSIVMVCLGIIGTFTNISVDGATLADAIFSIVTGVTGLIGIFGNLTRSAPIDRTLVLPGYRINNKIIESPFTEG